MIPGPRTYQDAFALSRQVDIGCLACRPIRSREWKNSQRSGNITGRQQFIFPRAVCLFLFRCKTIFATSTNRCATGSSLKFALIVRSVGASILHSKAGCSITSAQPCASCSSFPFNERYTAGLYSDIGPQDAYKSALDRQRVLQGASGNTDDKGYNCVFYYPAGGLDHLIRQISAECTIQFDYTVSGIDTRDRKVFFSNGRSLTYDRIISTIPLNQMARFSEIDFGGEADPATAVLVVNIGAVKGSSDFSPYQWVYLPSSSSGMHRFGFYNHVDSSFLPTNYRNRTDIVSIYAERSFLSASPPGLQEQSLASSAIVEELKDWGIISEPIVVSSTFTDPAYTWSRRGSTWAQHAIRCLAEAGIRQIGRYGGWHFQGMLESFEQGLSAGRSTTVEIARQI